MFDLDNTLYPHHVNLWEQVDGRIREYVATMLKLSHEDAFRLQKDYYKRYGTTMRGLMTEHGMAPDAFPRFRARDRSFAAGAEPGAGRTQSRQLPGRKLILTNGTRPSCRRSAQAARYHRLQFEDIFDIIAAELEPSPRRRPMIAS